MKYKSNLLNGDKIDLNIFYVYLLGCNLFPFKKV